MRPRTSRTELSARVSTSQISVTSSLLVTNDFQRGCVSQTISVAGNDSRNPATAGNVCTISPSEPRRTTRKRGSGMRSLADRIEQRPGGVVLRIADNGYANAKPRRSRALRHGVFGVIGSLCMNVRPQFLKQSFDVSFWKNYNVIDATQRGNEQRTRIFIEDRAIGAFQGGDAGISVDGDGKNVAFAGRTFEIPSMPYMQNIEAAIGEDNSLAAAFVLGEGAL